MASIGRQRSENNVSIVGQRDTYTYDAVNGEIGRGAFGVVYQGHGLKVYLSIIMLHCWVVILIEPSLNWFYVGLGPNT